MIAGERREGEARRRAGETFARSKKINGRRKQE